MNKSSFVRSRIARLVHAVRREVFDVCVIRISIKPRSRVQVANKRCGFRLSRINFCLLQIVDPKRPVGRREATQEELRHIVVIARWLWLLRHSRVYGESSTKEKVDGVTGYFTSDP